MRQPIVVTLTLFLGLCAVSGRVADAALTPARRAQAERLIEQLASADPGVRRDAVDQLIKMGADVIALVNEKREATHDDEVERCCAMVLKGVAERHGITFEPAEELGLDASRVTIHVTDAPVAEVLRRFAEQSGNAPIAVDEGLEHILVTLEVTRAPYWKALDELCTRAGLLYRHQRLGRPGDLRLVQRGNYIDVGGYAGPTVMKIESADVDQGYSRLKSTRSVGYLICCMWEDRLPVQLGAAVVTRAVTADGVELHPNYPKYQIRPGVHHRRGGFRRLLPRGYFTVHFRTIPAQTKTIAEISGTLTLQVGSGETVFAIDNVFEAEGRSVTKDGLTIAAACIERAGGALWIALRATRGGKPARLGYYTEGSPYGIYLVTPDGKRLRSIRFSADRLSARNFSDKMKPLLSRPFDKANHFVCFRRFERTEGPWSLIYCRPQKGGTREYPFTIRDIPLP